jgi:3-oxoacyl-[acyl-carrier-protein] synthase II
MKSRRRVVITGLGVVAPNGIGKEVFWQNLVAGKSAVRRITAFDPSPYPCQVAAEIRDFDPTAFMPARLARSVGRFTQLAIAAASLARSDANLPDSFADRYRTALCFGTSANGAADIGETNHRRFLSHARYSLDPVGTLETTAHAATAHVSQFLRISGPATTIASGCATGLDAVAWGCYQIESRGCDMAVVGATEAPLSEFLFALFAAGGFLSTWKGPPEQASRPYDRLRSGLVLAEAAGAVVLEEMDTALSRGAPIYAEILGSATVSEGGLAGNGRDLYQRGMQLALAAACRGGNRTSLDIDYVNAHGNSIPDSDAAETAGHKGFFGARAYKVPISSIKASVGQPLAAGGVLQLVTVALAIPRHLIPPTINLTVPDPDCDLDYVPTAARHCRLRTALVHAHSLGGPVCGSHTALLVSLFTERPV